MSRLAAAGALALLVGCASNPRPVAPSAPPPPPAPELPADLSPNVARDRRAEPGVRAPAKPLVLEASRTPKCGKLAPAVLGASKKKKVATESRELLEGRLVLHAPASSRLVPPTERDPSPEEESRLVVDGGGEGLAIVARETFQLDPDRYEPDADAPSKPGTLDEEAPKFLRATFQTDEKLDVAPVALEGGVRAYAARPRSPNAPPGRDTALVLAMLVAHPDGTLQSLGFYVRGEHVRAATGSALVGCTRLAERLAQTLAPGPRALERAPGLRRVLPVPGGDALAVRVPADYVVVRARDGGAALVTKLKPLSLYPGNIAIALGERPDGAGQDADETAPGKLLGRDVSWKKKTLPKGGGWLFAAEPLGEPDKPPYAQVLVKAVRQAKVLEEMRGVAETLAVIPAEGQKKE